jgi:hypothetical protein
MPYFVTRRAVGERLTIAETETWAEAAAIVKEKSKEDEQAWYSVCRTPRHNWKHRKPSKDS